MLLSIFDLYRPPFLSQSEDPAVRWQLNLYKDVVVRNEGPPDPEKTVDRVQSISAAVFNLEQVSSTGLNLLTNGILCPTYSLDPLWSVD